MFRLYHTAANALKILSLLFLLGGWTGRPPRGFQAFGQATATAATTTTTTTTTTSSAFPIYKQEEALRAAKSREIRNYMNQTVDPCDDFYEYACGNWHKYHTPSGKNEAAETTPTTILEHKVNKDLHNLLDENVTVDDGTAARKIKMFYKSCLEARHNEVAHQMFVSDFIKHNGGFPAVPGSNWLVLHHNYDWQHVVAVLRYSYGFDILIGMDIDNNYQSMHENSLYLREPSTLIPRSLCNARAAQHVAVTDREYDAIEQEVADNLKRWLTLRKEDALQLAADIVTFEYDLCRAMYPNDTDEGADEDDFIGRIKPEEYGYGKKYDRRSLVDFSHQFNNSVNFNAIVTNSFGIAVTKPVFMKSPKYYEQLIRVIEETEEYNKTIIANYIMYRAMTYINLPLNDTPHSRPAYCLQLVRKYFPKVLGDMYYRKYANTVDQDRVVHVFERLKSSFAESLNKDWIEDSTRRLGVRRLAEMQLQFPSYDKSAFNLEFVHNDFWTNLKLTMAEVRAYEVKRLFSADMPRPKDEVEAYETRMVYRTYHKRIDIGWAALQAPHYQPALPKAMRYALIGLRLAQTLATAFDDNGWSADTLDNRKWDSTTAVEYYKRANCFGQQIGNYLQNDPHSFNNASKTRELIAKSSGLNTAFNAYLDWLLYKDPSSDNGKLAKETLPELDFTNTQLFFITFAQGHCVARKKVRKPEPKVVISAWTRHTLQRYVVNGPLSNFKEFAREFHCTLGGEMNVADKCIIY